MDTYLCVIRMLEPIHSFLLASSQVFIMTLRVALHPTVVSVSGHRVTESRFTQSKLDASQRGESDTSGKGCEFEI